MSESITITEHVRFNSDGSSDHIKVVGDEMVSTDHYDVSPYVRIDCTEVAWFVYITKQTVSDLQETSNERTL